jgi:hypothetical protein
MSDSAKSLEQMSTTELIDYLAISIYKEPLSAARTRPELVSDDLRVAILIIDFDTEVSMNGILGFLENSAGAHLPQVILAFDRIGAQNTADCLREIQAVLNRTGVRSADLRRDLEATEEFEISSFAQRHGAAARGMAREVNPIARRLYLYRPSEGEAVFDMLQSYLEPRRNELVLSLLAWSER